VWHLAKRYIAAPKNTHNKGQGSNVAQKAQQNAQQKASQKEQKLYAGTGFVVLWTVLMSASLALAFAGRIFGYIDGPLFVSITIPLFVGVSSAILIIVGGFLFLRSLAKGDALGKRTSVMVMVLGACTLAAHFIFSGVGSLLLDKVV